MSDNSGGGGFLILFGLGGIGIAVPLHGGGLGGIFEFLAFVVAGIFMLVAGIFGVLADLMAYLYWLHPVVPVLWIAALVVTIIILAERNATYKADLKAWEGRRDDRVRMRRGY